MNNETKEVIDKVDKFRDTIYDKILKINDRVFRLSEQYYEKGLITQSNHMDELLGMTSDLSYDIDSIRYLFLDIEK